MNEVRSVSRSLESSTTTSDMTITKSPEMMRWAVAPFIPMTPDAGGPSMAYVTNLAPLVMSRTWTCSPSTMLPLRRLVAWSSPPCTYGRGSVRAQARPHSHAQIGSTCLIHIRKQGWSTQTSFDMRAPDAQLTLTKLATW